MPPKRATPKPQNRLEGYLTSAAVPSLPRGSSGFICGAWLSPLGGRSPVTWQSVWQSGRCHLAGRELTGRTADLTRPAAMLRGGTRQTGRVSLLIRSLQVRVPPGRQFAGQRASPSGFPLARRCLGQQPGGTGLLYAPRCGALRVVACPLDRPSWCGAHELAVDPRDLLKFGSCHPAPRR